MNAATVWERVKPWLKPGMMLFLGLILIFRPDTITSAVAVAIGFLMALVGTALLVSFFFGKNTRFSLMLVGLILMIMGFSILREPLTLASRMGQFAGILLLLQGLRSYGESASGKGKTATAVYCILGTVLILLPMTASRLMMTACGAVVLVIGIVMVIDRLREKKHLDYRKNDIIDAE